MRSSLGRMEKVIFASFLLLFVWIPVPLASHRPWAWSILEIWVALQTISLAWVYHYGLPWPQIKPARWLLVGLGLFQLWTAFQLIPLPLDFIGFISPKSYQLQLLFLQGMGVEKHFMSLSLDPELTTVALVKGCCYWLLALNTLILLNSPKRVRSLLIVAVVSGTFQAFYGAMLILSDMSVTPIAHIEVGNLATGSFIYKNHFANYLLMTLCLGLGLIVADLHTHRSGSWRVRSFRLVQGVLSLKMMVRLCLIIMVIGLVMSRSRMGNSAFFFSTVIGGVVALLIYKQRPQALSVLIVSILAIDTLIVSSLFGLSKVRDRLEATVLSQEGRIDIFGWAFDMLKDFPITGSGLGSFYSVFQHYVPYPLPNFYDFAHNDYLQFAIEAGIPATAILGISVIFCAVLCLQTIRVRHDHLMKGTALGCFMAIVGMLIHISVDFNLHPPANAATFIIVLTLACISYSMPIKGYQIEQ